MQLPTLTGNGVNLSPFTQSDSLLVQSYAGDQMVAKTTQHVPHPYPDGVAEKWIAAHLTLYLEQRNITLAIRTLEGDLVGAINLGLKLNDQFAELGYWIAHKYWGQGYCTRASKRIIQYGFEELSLNKIYARHLGGNIASGKVMKKVGMTREGIQRQHTIKDGVLQDIVEYSILRSEYQLG
ncbi:GNAT family N-acetyltransferase [Persicirhabdus sediminis]|uniref:GNAT family N-acetyltransferase n=1 Tax=Persicirhabdus sediminis TaxID=454144 RepID=A0A8J7SL76_9BACT|nr:GNAT family N-acetyltransferase [Persicirhabdus sediminis]MBK1790203.1 GNAT family N-acetyltransferase [Persicirhabdus sediminis]